MKVKTKRIKGGTVIEIHGSQFERIKAMARYRKNDLVSIFNAILFTLIVNYKYPQLYIFTVDVNND